jgi:hypothetical protein
MKITYLTPCDSWASVNKEFSSGNPPVMVSDYKMGRLFKYRVDEVIDTPEALCHSLRQNGKGSIRIIGGPNPQLEDLGVIDPDTPVRRKKANFPAPASGVPLLYVDLDDIPVPPALLKHFKYTDRDKTAEAVRNILVANGLELLANVKHVVLLTSRQWGNTKIRAHAYWVLEAPIALERLRAWGDATNTLLGFELFDPVSFREVQPDYIAPRTCIDFEDPLNEYHRLYVSTPGEGAPDRVPATEFGLLVEQTLTNAKFDVTQTQEYKPLTDDWIKTLELCGAEGWGVNEPSFRSAAKLVQQYGTAKVKADVQHFAELMHTKAWAAYNTNDPDRDLRKDIETYTVARFRQYITSAIDQKFGDLNDESEKGLLEAIDEATLGRVRTLFRDDILALAVSVRTNNPGAWAEIRTHIKQTLKGVVSVSEFEKAINQYVTRVSDSKEKEMLESGTLDMDAARSLAAKNENAFIDPVLDTFDFIVDQHGSEWAASESSDGSGAYNILPLNGLHNALFAKGLALSGDMVSERFGKKAIAKLFGSEDMGTTSRFKPVTVGLRVQAENEADINTPTWVDLGRQPSGAYVCAKVSEDGVEYVQHNESPIKWRIDETHAPVTVAPHSAVIERFGSTQALTEWTKKELLEGYFPCAREHRIPLLAWTLVALLGRGMAPLCEITGPQHSGKTVLAEFVLSLVDPRKGIAGTGVGGTSIQGLQHKDLYGVVAENHATLFDNISGLSADRQDVFCQIATGIKRTERILYSHKYEAKYIRKPVILTSIKEIITRNDLKSRRVAVRCIANNFARESKDILGDWSRDLPFLRAGMYWLLSDLIRRLQDNAKNGILAGYDARRMYITQAEELLLGRMYTDSERAYERNLEAVDSIQNSRFAIAFLAFVQGLSDLEYKKSFADLFEDYSAFCYEHAGSRLTVDLDGVDYSFRLVTSEAIPKNTRAMGGKLNMFEADLEAISGWSLTGRFRSKSGMHVKFMNRNFALDKAYEDLL